MDFSNVAGSPSPSGAESPVTSKSAPHEEKNVDAKTHAKSEVIKGSTTPPEGKTAPHMTEDWTEFDAMVFENLDEPVNKNYQNAPRPSLSKPGTDWKSKLNEQKSESVDPGSFDEDLVTDARVDRFLKNLEIPEEIDSEVDDLLKGLDDSVQTEEKPSTEKPKETQPKQQLDTPPQTAKAAPPPRPQKAAPNPAAQISRPVVAQASVSASAASAMGAEKSGKSKKHAAFAALAKVAATFKRLIFGSQGKKETESRVTTDQKMSKAGSVKGQEEAAGAKMQAAVNSIKSAPDNASKFRIIEGNTELFEKYKEQADSAESEKLDVLQLAAETTKNLSSENINKLLEAANEVTVGKPFTIKVSTQMLKALDATDERHKPLIQKHVSFIADEVRETLGSEIRFFTDQIEKEYKLKKK